MPNAIVAVPASNLDFMATPRSMHPSPAPPPATEIMLNVELIVPYSRAFVKFELTCRGYLAPIENGCDNWATIGAQKFFM
jgi:hypothetical protein